MSLFPEYGQSDSDTVLSVSDDDSISLPLDSEISVPDDTSKSLARDDINSTEMASEHESTYSSSLTTISITQSARGKKPQPSRMFTFDELDWEQEQEQEQEENNQPTSYSTQEVQTLPSPSPSTSSIPIPTFRISHSSLSSSTSPSPSPSIHYHHHHPTRMSLSDLDLFNSERALHFDPARMNSPRLSVRSSSTTPRLTKQLGAADVTLQGPSFFYSPTVRPRESESTQTRGKYDTNQDTNQMNNQEEEVIYSSAFQSSRFSTASTNTTLSASTSSTLPHCSRSSTVSVSTSSTLPHSSFGSPDDLLLPEEAEETEEKKDMVKGNIEEKEEITSQSSSLPVTFVSSNHADFHNTDPSSSNEKKNEHNSHSKEEEQYERITKTWEISPSSSSLPSSSSSSPLICKHSDTPSTRSTPVSSSQWVPTTPVQQIGVPSFKSISPSRRIFDFDSSPELQNSLHDRVRDIRQFCRSATHVFSIPHSSFLMLTILF